MGFLPAGSLTSDQVLFASSAANSSEMACCHSGYLIASFWEDGSEGGKLYETVFTAKQVDEIEFIEVRSAVHIEVIVKKQEAIVVYGCT